MNLTLFIKTFCDTDNIPQSSDFEIWVKAALATKVKKAEIGIRIVEAHESAQLNEQYRQRSGPTNILSFYIPIPKTNKTDFLLGDLVICAPVVQKEAQDMGINITEHWAHLIVHGCLHLLGYDHQLEEQAKIMESFESRILLSLGFHDPYLDD